jgi:hypothetical protein
VTSAIDVIVQLTRFPDGRRSVTGVAEVLPLDAQGRYAVRDIFVYRLEEKSDSDKGQLVWTGAKSQFGDEPKLRVLLRQAKLTGGIFAPAEAKAAAQPQEARA